MKLQELTEKDWNSAGLRLKLNSTPHQPLSRAVGAQASTADREYVGSGQGAYVDRSTSPHDMDNVQRIADEEDGTAIYHKLITQTPAIQDNPYIPRIRAQQTQQGVTYTIVERLVPFDSRAGNYEVMESMWDRMFSVPFAETELGREMKTMRQDVRDMELRTEICDVLQGMIGGRRSIKMQVIDENLVAAIAFLKVAKKKSGGSLDIHDGNMMIRITGTMPNLVFTDPFA